MAVDLFLKHSASDTECHTDFTHVAVKFILICASQESAFSKPVLRICLCDG